MQLPTPPRKEHLKKNKFYPNGKLTIMPYTVAQESLLLQINESDNPTEQLLAVKQIIEGCVKDKIDTDKLPSFVLEDLFIRLREISTGEFVKLTYRCKNNYTPIVPKSTEEVNLPNVTETCNNIVDYDFDLRKFVLTEQDKKNHSVLFKLTDTMGFKLHYPTLESVSLFEETGEENDFIVSCVESIYEGDDVFLADKTPIEDIKEFINALSLETKNEIRTKFIYTMPKLHFETDLTCSKCGHVNHLSFNSISDVFI